HRRQDGYHAPPRREALPGVQPARRLRRGFGAGNARLGDALREDGARVEDAPRPRRSAQIADGRSGIMSITAQHVTKRFGNFVALDDVTLEVPSGALLALLGPSGSGKTTLLRIIAGLETSDSGTVRYADEDVTDAAVRERNVGFVFQHYALFRHLSIFENV